MVSPLSRLSSCQLSTFHSHLSGDTRQGPGFPWAPRRVASHSNLTWNHFSEWLQAMDSLRKAGFSAPDGDPWDSIEEAAEGGK